MSNSICDATFMIFSPLTKFKNVASFVKTIVWATLGLIKYS